MGGEDEVTLLLRELEVGTPGARERLCEVVYQELRRLARARFRLREHTLQPTALVHEAWLRLGEQRRVPKNRAHFFRIASEVMLRVLRDHARQRGAALRGGNHRRIGWTVAVLDLAADGVDDEALCSAVEELRGAHARSARVVELRVFGGLTKEEAAEALGVSASTVERDWRAGKAWLSTRLRAERER